MKKFLLFIFYIFIMFSVSASLPLDDFGGQEIRQTGTHAQNELRIYPNPVETGRVTIEMNNGEISEVRLINIAGKEVVVRRLDFGIQKYILTLEDLPNGIYFVRVLSTENTTVVKKLIVSSR